MKKFFLLLVTSSLLFLTSCLEVLEDFYLNKDGSGKYIITMDMSELLSDPMMKSMIEEQAKKETGQDSDAPLEMDSIIHFRDAPGFAQLNAADQSIIKDVNIKMNASESQGEMVMQMEFPFKNFEDFAKMSEIMQKLDDGKGSSAAGGMMGGGLFGPKGTQFTLNKRVLSRLPMPDVEEILGDDAGSLDMMKMLLADAKYTTVYHLPGRVQTTDIPHATVDKKTVTVENNLIDIIEGKAKIAGDIKFKKK